MHKCKAPLLALAAIFALTGATITHVGTDNYGQNATATTSAAVTASQAPTLGNTVVVDFVLTTANNTPTPPAGYTCKTVTYNGNTDTYAACYHTAGASETTSLGTFSFASTAYCWATTEWSGVLAPTYSGGPGANYNSGGATVNVPYVAPSPSPAVVVGFAYTAASNLTATIPGWTVDKNNNAGGAECPSMSTFHSPVLSGTGSFNVNYSSGIGTGAGYIELTSPQGLCPNSLALLGIGC